MSMVIDPRLLARELFDARESGQLVAVPPSARDGGLDLATAYDVEAELTRMRRVAGHATVGRKVGYANKAVWRALKLQTLVWANMYDDTVHMMAHGFSLSGLRSPRIEPEVVVRLRSVPPPGSDAAGVLAAADWIALGFEIVDSPYPDWKFQPADFVASFGLHAGLVVGEPRTVRVDEQDALVEQLAAMKILLKRNGELVEEGSGRNALKSPALCVAELASAIANQPGAEPLRDGEAISTGTLTNPQPIAAGETWSVEADGIGLPGITVTVRP
jgi:2-oxo-3-hexenedioate decarboxylase